MYKHVLIATDGSELAQKGVDHGLALAKVLGATASIVVVSELFTGPVLADGADIGLMTTAAELRHELERSAEALLKSVGEQAERMGVPCETVHVLGVVPAEGILDTAAKRSCDLIVMASHGRRGIVRLVLGSQTAEVLAGATTPVLIVR